MDICPKDKNGRHNFKPLVPFGSPKSKPISAFCLNCGKEIDYSEVTQEVPFPSVNKNSKNTQ